VSGFFRLHLKDQKLFVRLSSKDRTYAVDTTDNSLVFRKPNHLIVMVPTLGKLSPISRKLYNVLLHDTQVQAMVKQASGEVIKAGDLFEARLADLLMPFNVDAADLSTVAKAHFREMKRTEVEWEAPDQGSEVVWASMSLLSEAKVIKRNNQLYFQWALPPTLFNAVMDPGLFTRMDLEFLIRLKSYAALALYEICVRYKNNPSGLTCVCEPEWWVDAISAKSNRDPAAGVKPKREWRKVKNEAVLKAIEEINNLTDIDVELIEKKTGKAVTQIQFVVRRKKLPDKGKGKATLSPELAAQAVKADVPLADVVGIVKASVGGEAVAMAALRSVERRAANDDLEQLQNKAAYARAVARDLDGYIAVADSKPSGGGRPNRGVTDAVISPLSAAKGKVSMLPLSEQHALANAVIEELKSKGLATPATVQGHAQFVSGSRLPPAHLLMEMAKRYLARSG
jgi:plasmid replication initiation protein